jgi:hypothetical protein
MSRSLSTGAEAAYGQPLAFTTGGNGKGKGTTANPLSEQKKNARKKKAKKANAANAAKKRKEQKEKAETETTHTVDPAMAAKIAGAVAAVLITKQHPQSSKKKKKNTRMNLSVENLQAFQAAKNKYLDQLVDITTASCTTTHADYQQQKAKAFQTMMNEKIRVLRLQLTITYKTLQEAENGESPKPSASASKMQKKIDRLVKDNVNLHMSKHTVDDRAFPEFKMIMHAYYTAELAASAMKDKERRDALKTAKDTKSASLKEWAKTQEVQDHFYSQEHSQFKAMI